MLGEKKIHRNNKSDISFLFSSDHAVCSDFYSSGDLFFSVFFFAKLYIDLIKLP